jgi:hypothetical protein
MIFKVQGVSDTGDSVTFMVNAESSEAAGSIAAKRGVKTSKVSPFSEGGEGEDREFGNISAAEARILRDVKDVEASAGPPAALRPSLGGVSEPDVPESEPVTRPMSVSVVGFFAIFLAILGIVAGAVRLPKLLYGVRPSEAAIKRLKAPQRAEAEAKIRTNTFETVATFGTMGANLLLLVGGFGCLRLRPWARAALSGYMLIMVLLLAATLIVFHMDGVHMMAASLKALMPSPWRGHMMVTYILALLTPVLFPVATMLILRHRSAQEAFDRNAYI